MSILKKIKDLNLKINKKKMSVFNISYQEQLSYINQFNEPRDCIERSFYQMKCQQRINGFLLTILYDIGSLFAILPFFIKFRYINKIERVQAVDAVCLLNFRKKHLMPIELEDKYRNILYVDDFSGLLKKEDTEFLYKLLRRYPFSPYFLFKSMCRIAIYAEINERYSPKAIMASAEYSFTSSILTKYANGKNISHINIMHGEKLFNIRDSFIKFNQFFIWDEYYKELFSWLKADLDQFVTYRAKALYFTDSKYKNEPTIDFKYYLAHPTLEELRRIVASMKILESKGYKIKIRPHPLLLELDMLKQVVSTEYIELPSETKIDQSINDSINIIGEYSTVLSQAYNVGRQIVIDDVTHPDHYEVLESLKYIMLSKPHKRLSDILEDGGEV